MLSLLLPTTFSTQQRIGARLEGRVVVTLKINRKHVASDFASLHQRHVRHNSTAANSLKASGKKTRKSIFLFFLL